MNKQCDSKLRPPVNLAQKRECRLKVNVTIKGSKVGGGLIASCIVYSCVCKRQVFRERISPDKVHGTGGPRFLVIRVAKGGGGGGVVVEGWESACHSLIFLRVEQ